MPVEALPLTTIGIIILISIIFSTIIRKLGQNEVIGFILAGFLLGPFFLGFLHPQDQLVVGFAELGLFVLLFYLGIELSLKDFLAAGSTIFGLAMIDMALTTGIGVFVMLLLGYSLTFSIIVGIMLFCTSTAIVAKFILNRNLLENRAAKTSISILILQDFLGILLLVFVTSSTTKGSVIDLAVNAVVFAVTAFFAVFHLSRLVEDWMRANDFGHTEITLYALGVGLVTATLASILGLSTAIGAYFAGFALSETGSGHKIKKDVGFLRDFFLVFFFVGFGTTLFYDTSLGAISIPSLDRLAYMAGLSAGLGVLAICAHSIAARVFGPLFGLTAEDSTLMAVLLSPLGEFVVIIATVTFGILAGLEKTMVGPLAFLLIISTLLIFQPLYNMRHLHQKLFSIFPQIQKPKEQELEKKEPTHAMHLLREAVLNFFVVICFAQIAILLFDQLPRFGVPVVHSREVTSFLLFIFFAVLPLKRGISALNRLIREIIGKKDRQAGHELALEKAKPLTGNVKNLTIAIPSGKNAKAKKRTKK